MCLGAIYWARPKKIFYACTKTDAAAINFDDDFIYQELELPLSARSIPAEPLLRKEGILVFQEWQAKEDKTEY